MGFTVVNNKKNIDTSIISKASQYMNSRPDLVVYHSDNLVAYVVHTADPEPDVTLVGGMTENKLDKGRDALGQLMAGMEKVAGDLAYLHILRNIDISKRKFTFIEIFGVLVSLRSETCKIYKLVMNFKRAKSVLFMGKQELKPSEAMSILSGRTL